MLVLGLYDTDQIMHIPHIYTLTHLKLHHIDLNRTAKEEQKFFLIFLIFLTHTHMGKGRGGGGRGGGNAVYNI